jgi:hypothetical protein
VPFLSGPDRTKKLNHRHMLVISIEAVQLNCHFFCLDEIELDVDPREVVTEADHLGVLNFVRDLSNSCNLPAVLTPENCQESPFLRYVPSSGKWLVL